MEVVALAAPNNYEKLEEQEKKKTRKTCLIAGIGVAVLTIVLFLILFFVFKPKKPKIRIESVQLQNLDFSLDMPRLSVNLNLTILTDIAIRNPNKARFKYRNSTALLRYRDRLVGVVPIPAGKIGSDGKAVLNLSVTVMADRVVSDSQLYSDAITGGTLPMSTEVKLSGKVTVMGFIKFHLSTSSSCSFNVNLYNRTVSDQQCRYQNKL